MSFTLKEGNKRIEELEWCAILQGYGRNLYPLYKHPVVDMTLYLKLWNILKLEVQGE